MQYIHCKYVQIGVTDMDPKYANQKIKQDICLGRNIRRLRRQSHLTQEDVVTQLQLQGLSTSRSSYSQIECGTYNIRVSELVALVELFGTDYNAVFSDLPSKRQ